MIGSLPISARPVSAAPGAISTAVVVVVRGGKAVYAWAYVPGAREVETYQSGARQAAVFIPGTIQVEVFL